MPHTRPRPGSAWPPCWPCSCFCTCLTAPGRRPRDRGGHRSSTAFGKIAVGLAERQAETAFQTGLRGFSKLLVRVAAVLTISIFVINVALSRPLLDALLFSLAIAIGISCL